MPSDTAASPFRFFVFTCRGEKSDFRLHLVEALRQQHETYYIWLKRRPVVTGPHDGAGPEEMSIGGLAGFLRRFRPDGKVNIYLNSTNTYFPTTMAVLRLLARAGVWCLDMHDDLRYHNTGLKRLREDGIIRLMRATSDVTVHAAPTLIELFPGSRHLGNASHLRPMAHEAGNGVLIIASFDERLDFDFLERVVALRPAMQFHLHGWIQQHDTGVQQRMQSICARFGNVHHHGPYATAELPNILGRYRVSLAPYRADSPLTRYIDPLRFYHCLNAGLEMVSTAIPQARYMSEWIHVVCDPEACVETLDAVIAEQSAKQPAYTPITWEQRVTRLVDILRGVPLVRASGVERFREMSLPAG